MSTEQAAIEGAQAAHDAARDWQAVHSDASIQYAPLPELSEKAAEPPVWLKALGELLRDLFEPIGRAFGMSWEVLKWVLIGIGALILLYAATYFRTDRRLGALLVQLPDGTEFSVGTGFSDAERNAPPAGLR